MYKFMKPIHIIYITRIFTFFLERYHCSAVSPKDLKKLDDGVFELWEEQTHEAVPWTKHLRLDDDFLFLYASKVMVDFDFQKMSIVLNCC